MAPYYITELVTIKLHSSYNLLNLRSNSELLLQRPRIKTSVTLGDRSFALAAPLYGTRCQTKYVLLSQF